MRYITTIGLIYLLAVHLNAQSGTKQDPFQASTPVDQLTIGIGGGLDYGGLGVNLSYYPIKNVGLFGGVGYALAGAGFNAGVKYRYIPGKPDARIRPFGLAMYGYNAAILVINASHNNKLFYGPTLGAGIDFHRNLQKRGYWSFSILVPFRKPEVETYMEDLENEYGADFQNSLFPIAVSIGYRFIIL